MSTYGGVNTPDKLASHKKINTRLFLWLAERVKKNQFSRIVTMPANSGVQENQILNLVDQLEVSTSLQTYDRDFSARETGIRKHPSWNHTVCSDIFREMVFSLDSGVPTFVWFDLCGGLSEQVRLGTLNAAKYVLNHPATQIYFTLQVKGCRNMGCASVIERLYHSTGNQLEQNINITTRAIEALLPYKTVSETIQTYRRKGAYYAVLGFKYEKNME